MKKTLLVFGFILLGCFVMAENKNGWNYDANIAISSNGKALTGGEIGTSIFHRNYLSKDESILFKNSKIDLGLENLFTPTSNETLAFVKYEPIAFFDVTLKGGYIYMFKALGYGFYKLDNANSDYKSESLKKLDSSDKFGYRVVVSPTLKFKYQNIIAVNSTNISMSNLNYDGYYLNWRSYAVEKGNDINWTNSTYLLYEQNKCLTYGITYDYQSVPTSSTTRRISLTAITSPSILKENDGYLVMFLGRDLTANEAYIAVKTGFGGKLF